jgi:hypothetical protein
MLQHAADFDDVSFWAIEQQVNEENSRQAQWRLQSYTSESLISFRAF